MAQTVGDYLLERLRAWDMRHVFGYPGELTARGIAQKPGGWSNARYNLEMGPPLLVTMVGGRGPASRQSAVLG